MVRAVTSEDRLLTVPNALSVIRLAGVPLFLWLLRRAGFGPPEVTYMGKAATFALMYAFPLLLLAQGSSTAATIARPIAYAFAIWGSVLFVWSGLLYVAQARSALRGRAL